MIVFGGLAAVVGVVLFHAALGMTLRANRTTNIPFYRNAETVPAGSTALRATGAGLLVLAAVLLSTVAWWWPFIIVAVGPVLALTLITIHNRRPSTERGRR